MGFFKNIGKGIKKLTKKIELKGLVKGIKNFGGFIPGVGGVVSGVIGQISDQHEAKKLAREQHAQELGMQQAVQAEAIRTGNPDIKDILNGAVGGALSGAGTVLAGSSQATDAGAKLVDGTMSTWLKTNWLKLVGFISAVTIFIVILVRVLKPKHKYRR